MNDSNHLSMKPSRERQQPFVAADTLAKALDRLQEYMELRQMYHAAMREMTTKLKNLDEEFCIRFDRNPIHHIESRLKSTESIIGKMKAKDCEIFVDSIRHNITDLAGVRVICHYLRDVETLAEMLLKRDDIELCLHEELYSETEKYRLSQFASVEFRFPYVWRIAQNKFPLRYRFVPLLWILGLSGTPTSL